MVTLVSRQNLGKVVISAGWIDLDLEPRSTGYNEGSLRRIPPGYKMVLKAIIGDYAYLYHHNNGVMRFPFNLLEPWE